MDRTATALLVIALISVLGSMIEGAVARGPREPEDVSSLDIEQERRLFPSVNLTVLDRWITTEEQIWSMEIFCDPGAEYNVTVTIAPRSIFPLSVTQDIFVFRQLGIDRYYFDMAIDTRDPGDLWDLIDMNLHIRTSSGSQYSGLWFYRIKVAHFDAMTVRISERTWYRDRLMVEIEVVNTGTAIDRFIAKVDPNARESGGLYNTTENGWRYFNDNIALDPLSSGKVYLNITPKGHGVFRLKVIIRSHNSWREYDPSDPWDIFPNNHYITEEVVVVIDMEKRPDLVRIATCIGGSIIVAALLLTGYKKRRTGNGAEILKE